METGMHDYIVVIINEKEFCHSLDFVKDNCILRPENIALCNSEMASKLSCMFEN